MNIVETVSKYVELEERPGSEVLWGLCPFCSDKTPSLAVDQNKQLYHCFTCGAGGNAEEFITRRKAKMEEYIYECMCNIINIVRKPDYYATATDEELEQDRQGIKRLLAAVFHDLAKTRTNMTQIEVEEVIAHANVIFEECWEEC